jgi:photosystem II stability/assembly factor-like uncharacterized protein
MAIRTDDRIMLLAGTRDGLYVYEGTCRRDRWDTRGPYLEGFEISNAVLDPRDGRTIWSTVVGNGMTGVYRSFDRGETWEQAGDAWDVDLVWQIAPGHAAHPGRVYVGVRPAGLYQSDDYGDTWEPVHGLNEHPSTGEWWEGGGGKMLHTILTDAADPNDLTVAISVAGVFRSTDGGQKWEPSNDGTVGMGEFWASEFGDGALAHPGVHRCVHKIARHPARSDVLFQQNHDGVYVSSDRGRSWTDVSEGVRDRFGFVIGATRDGACYVVPQDMHAVRYSGQLEVYRLREGAGHWDVLTDGLPVVDNITLYRDGMTTDNCLPGGVYFGTSAGDIYATRDGGERWSKLASGLPPVRSVSCEHHS